ncbi:MAG: histidine kinase [Bacteroidetes bacterium]|nr:histidine kinase [Bacteroidota bacterium]
MFKLAVWLERLRQNGYHHILFWFFYLAFWTLTTFDDQGSFVLRLQNVSMTLLFHALVAYFNLYVLIPGLLQKKLYISYTIALLLSISLVCYPILYMLYLINRDVANTDLVWNTRFFFVTALAVSYTVFTTTALKLFFDWFQKEKEARELSILNRETELKYLKNQINPHFLFNSLNNLYSLSLKKSDKAPEVILKLSEILRYLLYESSAEFVPLDKEIDYLKNYVEIERLRFGNRLKIEFEEHGDFQNQKIVPMLIIPFVENAFKHGPAKNNEAGLIEITIELMDDWFFFRVRNNVFATKEVFSLGDGGIGNQNVEKRLELLYPSRYQLNQTKSDEHYVVQLKLKLK